MYLLSVSLRTICSHFGGWRTSSGCLCLLLEVSPPVHRHPQIHSATQSHTKMVTGVWMALLVTKSICPLAQPPPDVCFSPGREAKGSAMPGHQDCRLILTTFLWHILGPQSSGFFLCQQLLLEPPASSCHQSRGFGCL